MTNPIMPGIEKLAEKYGLDAYKKPEIIQNDPDDFSMSENDLFYIIKGLKFNNKNVNIGFLKWHLGFGKKLNYFNWLEDNINISNPLYNEMIQIPSVPLYFSLIDKLRKNNHPKYTKLINDLKEDLMHDFINHEIQTSSVMLHALNFKSIMSHQTDTANGYRISENFKGDTNFIKSTKISDILVNSLTEMTKLQATECIEWLFQAPIEIIRNVKIQNNSENLITCQYNKDDGIFRINIENDIGKPRKARGIYFRE